MHILFVCTGNICRSPTAERLVTAFAARHDLSHLRASSAGTRAVIGHQMHRNAAAVLEGLGGDASAFAARQLTPKVVAGVDLVLTMSRAHRDAVLELAPRLFRRTFTLTEAAYLVSEAGAQDLEDLARLRPQVSTTATADVPDPIDGEAEVFERVGSLIARHLAPILDVCGRAAGDGN